MPQTLTIAITGTTGFIGGYLLRRFRERGHSVVALARRAPAVALEGVTYRRFALGSPVVPTDLAGCDVLIHCAYAKPPADGGADAVNEEGSRALYLAARASGIRKFVFVSSLSAHPAAESRYGRSKLEIERMLDPSTDLVLRPGLVLGRGGLFASIVRLVRTAWVVPLVDGGSQRIQAIDIDDLGRCVEMALQRDLVGGYTLVAERDFTLRELVEEIRERSGRRRLLLPVPYRLVDAAFAAIGFLRLPFPVSRENLRGLRHVIVWESGDCRRVFGFTPRPFAESIQRLLTGKS